ncbi:MAG: NlpC/P60 family protein [Peptostreptococcaceae bacterium]
MKRYVIANQLNLRIGPGTNYSVILVLSKGQEVEILQEGVWCKIKYLDKIGYVSNSYLGDKNPIDLINRQQDIIKFSKTKLGSAYVYGTEGPNSFDCSGFVKFVYENVTGINMPRTSVDQSKFGTLVQLKDLKPCDLMFFDTDQDGKINHVGIYLGNNTMIHASTSQKKVIIVPVSDYYIKRFVNARRILK